MNASSTPPSPVAPAPGDQRLGLVGGDRPCARCGFSLNAQPIFREKHYGLVVVRCPECAEIAALQEYPALGRWAGRLAGAFALAWLVVVLGAGFGTGLVLYSLARGSVTDVLYPAGVRLSDAYRAYMISESEKLTDPVQRQQRVAWADTYKAEDWQIIGPEYVGTPDYTEAFDAILPSERMDLGRARSIGWLGLAAFTMGAGWAVLVPHLRRRGLTVLAVVLVLVAAGRWGVAVGLGSSPNVWGSYFWATDLAFDRYGAGLMPFAVAAGGVALLAGMLIGRPVARWLIVLLLPPRLRAPFGPLWTLQGLNVPAPRRRRNGT